VGGASLAGGVGSVTKTIIGAFLIGILTNIMNLMALPPIRRWCSRHSNRDRSADQQPTELMGMKWKSRTDQRH
jgi:hypothetical protein